MKHQRMIGMLLALAVVSGGIWMLTQRAPLTRQGASKAVYYCPMHPSYTSDRPGDCPICNMKLVKREVAPSAGGSSSEKSVQPPKDICYLHQCPKVHDGVPCPMLVVAKSGEKVTCPLCGSHVVESEQSASTKRVLYWTDPMMPGYRSDQPGTSPMGMELVPVYEEAAAASYPKASFPQGHAPILVTPHKQQFIGVKTAPVARRRLTKTIRTVGRIAYDPQLYQTQQEYLQALKGWQSAKENAFPELREQARRLVEASRMRLRLMGLGPELIEEIATSGEPDQRLLLADSAKGAWLYATVYEFELPLVKVGQTVMAELPAMPDHALTGTIRSIDPVLDPSTRSVRVRAILADQNGLLKPEMFVNVSIAIDLGAVVAIPESAVFETGIARLVFVDKGSGLFEPRDVILGVKADGYGEVKRGVVEGERVVTSGNFLIDSESRLKAALEGISESGLPARAERNEADGPAEPDQEKTGAAPAYPAQREAGRQAGEHQHGQ